MATKPNKFNIAFSEEASEMVEKMAADQGKTKADVVRQALTIKKWFDQTRKSGSKIIVEEPDGKLKEVLPLS